ncbi:hypothetical protein CDCA_CDCA04G1426 [Cyanidium caldarium]|uniref:MARVEL domain-containing protein n=1 Tax=Cyanidium caldarium TaxID=2771 RepID=A0AAV9ITA0_CYACA|nr:hypothetical protein CDCA_CDCA04G1426 [Cyanidium caldarium]
MGETVEGVHEEKNRHQAGERWSANHRVFSKSVLTGTRSLKRFRGFSGIQPIRTRSPRAPPARSWKHTRWLSLPARCCHTLHSLSSFPSLIFLSMRLGVLSSVRLLLYAGIVTLSVASFALIVHDLRNVGGTGFCELTQTVESSTCNYGVAINVVFFALAVINSVLVLVASSTEKRVRLLCFVETLLNGTSGLNALAWAITLSARVSKDRSTQVNAVLGFAWVIFSMLVIVYALNLARWRRRRICVTQEGNDAAA